MLFALKHFQGCSQNFSRGTHNFPNLFSLLSFYNNLVTLYTSTVTLYTTTLLLFPRFSSSVSSLTFGCSKEKSVISEKYLSKKQIELEELMNIVLFKFFSDIWHFYFILLFFLASTFSGTHVCTVRTGSYAPDFHSYTSC